MDQSQLGSSDLLIVAVINQSVYSAGKAGQFINTSPTQATAGKARLKPTKEQAQDSLHILGVLTAIAKTHPQDAQFMIDNFGIHGKYEKIRNDRLAVKNLSIELSKVFERHKAEFPILGQYLTKLAQKSM